MVLNVTPRPFTRPGTAGIELEHHLQDAGGHDVHQAQWDQHFPRKALELIFTEARVGKSEPVDEERYEHHLAEQDEWPNYVENVGILSILTCPKKSNSLYSML